MSGEVFHKFLLKGTETMKKNGANKWLSGDREKPVLTTEDMKWGETNWFPQTLQAGGKLLGNRATPCCDCKNEYG